MKVHSEEQIAVATGPRQAPRSVTVRQMWNNVQQGPAYSATYLKLRFLRRKYGLLISSVPLVITANIIRFIIATHAGFVGYYAINDVTTVLAGGIFLIGFMMNGVVADYKESERIPAEIASALFGVEDLLTCFLRSKPTGKAESSGLAAQRAVLAAVDSILTWFGSGAERDSAGLLNTISDLSVRFHKPIFDLNPSGFTRLTAEVCRLRTLMSRVAVISSSTYLPAGYALVELYALLAHILVILARYPSDATCYAVITGVTIIYGGMLRLMRDVDDPFEYKSLSITPVYDKHGNKIVYSKSKTLSPAHPEAHSLSQDGGTEVALDVLLDFRQALRKRIEEAEAEERKAKKAAEVTPAVC